VKYFVYLFVLLLLVVQSINAYSMEPRFKFPEPNEYSGIVCKPSTCCTMAPLILSADSTPPKLFTLRSDSSAQSFSSLYVDKGGHAYLIFPSRKDVGSVTDFIKQLQSIDQHVPKSETRRLNLIGFDGSSAEKFVLEFKVAPELCAYRVIGPKITDARWHTLEDVRRDNN